MPKFSQIEIPLEQNNSRRLIPWIIALMVYLGTLALTGAVLLHRLIESGQRDFKNGFIVELQAKDDHLGQTSLQDIEKQGKLLHTLRSLPGVARAEVFASDPSSSAVDVQKPLSQKNARSHPVVIDVTLSDDARVDISTLELELRSLFSGVSLKDHQAWRKTLLEMGHSLLGISLIVACAIGFASVVTIAFVTHSGLIIHEKVIQILRLIGAEDRFIARQFQAHSLKMALKGGVAGAFLSGVTYFVMKHRLQRLNLDFFPARQDETELWFVIFFTPLFMMAIVMFSARMTVLFSMQEE
ncbi:MAG: hypothetical protein JNK42_03235 [Caedimonas sp.]|jgi:cell division transport system permease protein|nr:hypothetical protein [Caedimonas sp.]